MATCLTQSTIQGQRMVGPNIIDFEYLVTVDVSCVNNQQTWTYTITLLQGQEDAIGNFSVEICEFFTDANFIDDGGGDIGSPNAGQDCLADPIPPVLNRIKFDVDNTPLNVPVSVSFILNGCFEKVQGRIAIKDGGNIIGTPNDQCFPVSTICTPGCNTESLPQPPRGTPFSKEEKITSIFRKYEK